MHPLRAASLAAALPAALAAVAADKVTNLPGWSPTPLLSDMYSGYLSVASSSSHFHYVLFESQSNPSTDPLTWWLNGGPGCSSLEGMMYENGPYWIDQASNTLYQNKYSWNNISNVVYLESPAGVGFSYTDEPSGLIHDDNKTQAENLEAMLNFYAKYPEYLNRPLYLTGESYAGVYVPMFAAAIIAHNAAGNKPQIPLAGIAVGNGCIGHEVGACSGKLEAMPYFIDTWRGHGLIAASTYAGIQRDCGSFNETSTACTNIIATARAEIGSIDVYNIYGPCVFNDTPADGGAAASTAVAPSHKWRAPVPEWALPIHPTTGGPLACIDGGAGIAYLNRPEVYTALHVAPLKWSACTANASFSYTRTMADEREYIYPAILAAGLRVLIYNGEADACVPLADNEAWVTSGVLGLKLSHGWHAWMADADNVGGYADVYAENNFTFATVRGAGHMVPQTQPASAWVLFNNFINGIAF